VRTELLRDRGRIVILERQTAADAAELRTRAATTAAGGAAILIPPRVCCTGHREWNITGRCEADRTARGQATMSRQATQLALLGTQVDGLRATQAVMVSIRSLEEMLSMEQVTGLACIRLLHKPHH
jgi:hypothetical protein